MGMGLVPVIRCTQPVPCGHCWYCGQAGASFMGIDRTVGRRFVGVSGFTREDFIAAMEDIGRRPPPGPRIEFVSPREYTRRCWAAGWRTWWQETHQLDSAKLTVSRLGT